jgi:Starch-binding associating with outer membrane
MILNKKILYIVTAGLLLFGTGCKKYLDVNQNLNSPTSLPVSVLLTGVERSLGNNMTMGSGLSAGLACYIHWHSVRGGADAYGLKGDNMDGSWFGFYTLISNLNVIINQAPGESRYAYAGIAKILKAYTYSVMVDVWGDIPFSEFDQFKNGIKQPKFDDDAAIYPQLLTMLDAGIADLNNPAGSLAALRPTVDDVIYGGSTSKWIKAANTIKLKLYTQLRLVQNVTPQVTALLASPSTLINATNETFLMPFGPLGASDDRNNGFDDYFASQRNQHVSPWLYEIMKGISPNPYTHIFNGIVDPRIPYYIFNQLAVSNPAVPPNTTEYRDGPFVSIYFASRGPNRDGSQQTAISLFGIYPVGGRYDDGLGQVTSPASGTGAGPYRFITYADRLYLEAELINAGVIAGDARAKLSAAMAASFEQVDYVITGFVKPSQTVPLLMGANGATPTAAVTSYINGVLGVYDAGNTAKKLEVIMTQKWLSSVGSAVDAYTDYRRTGYPVLFNPNNALMAPGGRAQPPLNGNPILNALGQTQPSVPVVLTTNYPQSLPWSQVERELNSNAPPQKPDPATYKIFWKP